MGAENRFDVVPTAVIPLEVGTEWKKSLTDGDEVTVTLLVDSIFEERETWNVIAETKAGDPDNVVFLGAHLDSVQAGPGVNDDGSGTAALLVILESLIKHEDIQNKVRFGWWGAEEVGLVGSLYHTSQLSAEEADKIRYYFNYDMIGSPNPSFTVYRGEEIGSKKLFDSLEAAGKPAEYGYASSFLVSTHRPPLTLLPVLSAPPPTTSASSTSASPPPASSPAPAPPRTPATTSSATTLTILTGTPSPSTPRRPAAPPPSSRSRWRACPRGTRRRRRRRGPRRSF